LAESTKYWWYTFLCSENSVHVGRYKQLWLQRISDAGIQRLSWQLQCGGAALLASSDSCDSDEREHGMKGHNIILFSLEQSSTAASQTRTPHTRPAHNVDPDAADWPDTACLVSLEDAAVAMAETIPRRYVALFSQSPSGQLHAARPDPTLIGHTNIRSRTCRK
jgi:hypothetical protein